MKSVVAMTKLEFNNLVVNRFVEKNQIGDEYVVSRLEDLRDEGIISKGEFVDLNLTTRRKAGNG